MVFSRQPAASDVIYDLINLTNGRRCLFAVLIFYHLCYFSLDFISYRKYFKLFAYFVCIRLCILTFLVTLLTYSYLAVEKFNSIASPLFFTFCLIQIPAYFLLDDTIAGYLIIHRPIYHVPTGTLIQSSAMLLLAAFLMFQMKRNFVTFLCCYLCIVTVCSRLFIEFVRSARPPLSETLSSPSIPVSDIRQLIPASFWPRDLAHLTTSLVTCVLGAIVANNRRRAETELKALQNKEKSKLELDKSLLRRKLTMLKAEVNEFREEAHLKKKKLSSMRKNLRSTTTPNSSNQDKAGNPLNVSGSSNNNINSTTSMLSSDVISSLQNNKRLYKMGNSPSNVNVLKTNGQVASASFTSPIPSPIINHSSHSTEPIQSSSSKVAEGKTSEETDASRSQLKLLDTEFDASEASQTTLKRISMGSQQSKGISTHLNVQHTSNNISCVASPRQSSHTNIKKLTSSEVNTSMITTDIASVMPACLPSFKGGALVSSDTAKYIPISLSPPEDMHVSHTNAEEEVTEKDKISSSAVNQRFSPQPLSPVSPYKLSHPERSGTSFANKSSSLPIIHHHYHNDIKTDNVNIISNYVFDDHPLNPTSSPLSAASQKIVDSPEVALVAATALATAQNTVSEVYETAGVAQLPPVIVTDHAHVQEDFLKVRGTSFLGELPPLRTKYELVVLRLRQVRDILEHPIETEESDSTASLREDDNEDDLIHRPGEESPLLQEVLTTDGRVVSTPPPRESQDALIEMGKFGIDSAGKNPENQAVDDGLRQLTSLSGSSRESSGDDETKPPVRSVSSILFKRRKRRRHLHATENDLHPHHTRHNRQHYHNFLSGDAQDDIRHVLHESYQRLNLNLLHHESSLPASDDDTMRKPIQVSVSPSFHLQPPTDKSISTQERSPEAILHSSEITNNPASGENKHQFLKQRPNITVKTKPFPFGHRVHSKSSSFPRNNPKILSKNANKSSVSTSKQLNPVKKNPDILSSNEIRDLLSETLTWCLEQLQLGEKGLYSLQIPSTYMQNYVQQQLGDTSDRVYGQHDSSNHFPHMPAISHVCFPKDLLAEEIEGVDSLLPVNNDVQDISMYDHATGSHVNRVWPNHNVMQQVVKLDWVADDDADGGGGGGGASADHKTCIDYEGRRGKAYRGVVDWARGLNVLLTLQPSKPVDLTLNIDDLMLFVEKEKEKDVQLQSVFPIGYWGANVRELPPEVANHPLGYTGIRLMAKTLSSCCGDVSKLGAFLGELESRYRPNVYHSQWHAADVLNGSYALLQAWRSHVGDSYRNLLENREKRYSHRLFSSSMTNQFASGHLEGGVVDSGFDTNLNAAPNNHHYNLKHALDQDKRNIRNTPLTSSSTSSIQSSPPLQQYEENPDDLTPSDEDSLNSVYLCQGDVPFWAQLSILLAAASHDVGHDGKNNLYRSNSMCPLSTLFGDKSPLERMHSSIMLSILRSDLTDILSPIAYDVRKKIVTLAIECVLNTDMSLHFKTVGKLRNFDPEYGKVVNLSDVSDLELICSSIVKAADIGHAAKLKPLHLDWSARVMAEFLIQGDTEKRQQLPVSPLCSRGESQNEICKSQAGFLGFVVEPLFDALGKVISFNHGMSDARSNIRSNLTFWQNCERSECTDDEAEGKECIVAFTEFMVQVKKYCEEQHVCEIRLNETIKKAFHHLSLNTSDNDRHVGRELIASSSSSHHHGPLNPLSSYLSPEAYHPRRSLGAAEGNKLLSIMNSRNPNERIVMNTIRPFSIGEDPGLTQNDLNSSRNNNNINFNANDSNIDNFSNMNYYNNLNSVTSNNSTSAHTSSTPDSCFYHDMNKKKCYSDRWMPSRSSVNPYYTPHSSTDNLKNLLMSGIAENAGNHPSSVSPPVMHTSESEMYSKGSEMLSPFSRASCSSRSGVVHHAIASTTGEVAVSLLVAAANRIARSTSLHKDTGLAQASAEQLVRGINVSESGHSSILSSSTPSPPLVFASSIGEEQVNSLTSPRAEDSDINHFISPVASSTHAIELDNGKAKQPLKRFSLFSSSTEEPTQEDEDEDISKLTNNTNN